MKSKWQKAQEEEARIHYIESFEIGYKNYDNSYTNYFRFTGVNKNLNGKTILEIGPGHFPALAYCENYSKSYIVEPMNSEYLNMCINGKNIELIKKAAEDTEFPKVDEIWIYNLLTHVIDPEYLIEKCKRNCKIIRFFEPIETTTDVCHLHTFTIQFFKDNFGNCVQYYAPNQKIKGFHEHQCVYGIYEVEDYQYKNLNFNFQSIPKFCINLKRSSDRRKIVQNEFKKFKLDVTFVEAIDKKNIILPELSTKNSGIYACFQSHLKIIQYAEKLNFENICIFEDDVIFCDDFFQRINYIETLKNFSYDMFYLGGHFAARNINNNVAEKTKWPYIYKAIAIGGAYAYILNKRIYEFILRNATYNWGSDQFYSDVLCKKFDCYAFVPFLVGCRPCVSMITDNYWDYENVHWYYQQEKINL